MEKIISSFRFIRVRCVRIHVNLYIHDIRNGRLFHQDILLTRLMNRVVEIIIFEINELQL